MQQSLSNKWRISAAILMVVTILFLDGLMPERPKGDLVPESPSPLHFIATDSSPIARPGWRLHGAWVIESEDQRSRGISGLEMQGGILSAVTDRGFVFDFRPPAPGSSAQRFSTLQMKGPGGQVLDSHDGEALAFDLDGSMWIATERVDALYHYSASVGSADAAVPIISDWPLNGGVEALISPYRREPMIALIERRSRALLIREGEVQDIGIEGGLGWPTGGARLADGRMVVLTRLPGPFGFKNRIGLARLDGERLVIGPMIDLPVGRLDNLEGIATAPLPGGATRLWIIADDNAVWYQRSLLVAYDVEADAWP